MSHIDEARLRKLRDGLRASLDAVEEMLRLIASGVGVPAAPVEAAPEPAGDLAVLPVNMPEAMLDALGARFVYDGKVWHRIASAYRSDDVVVVQKIVCGASNWRPAGPAEPFTTVWQARCVACEALYAPSHETAKALARHLWGHDGIAWSEGAEYFLGHRPAGARYAGASWNDIITAAVRAAKE